MDAELVRLARLGDHDAFTRLTETCDERFHGIAYGILRDMTLAEDAVQHALLTLWRDLPTLRQPAAFEAWSYRLLVRACYAASRRQRRWMPSLLPERHGDPTGDGGLHAVIDRDQLDRGFRRLSIDQRTIVVLRHYLDLPLERVAEVLDIPLGTARSRLHRSLQSMRAALEADARTPHARPGRTAREPGRSAQEVVR
jgi:RNA polymerase sigma factor (sigma-70 family)